jgi:poly-gamma-glutamate system protein
VKDNISLIKLGVLFLVLTSIVTSIQLFFQPTSTNIDLRETAAQKLADEWFTIIEKVKMEKGISFDEWKHIKYGALIGVEFSNFTTTLGSLEAKQTSLNTKFAGLVYRWLKENHIDSTKTVGLIISGSFPSLAISSLAAIQIIGAKVVLLSSLGSSTYGANEPQATWIDYETWLRNRTKFSFISSLITLGGENDAGEGMSEEGIKELQLAIKRNSAQMYLPSSLKESINTKIKILFANKISLLINIGGNQAAIGACAHSPVLPNGTWYNYSACNHNNRGIISRIYESGIPVIHLINIRDLATKYGLVIGRVE